MAKVQRKLQNYLILNKYMSSMFGLRDMKEFSALLKPIPDGLNYHNKLHFTEVLQNLKITDEFRQKLNLYDENIQEYLNHINQKRDPPIVLKYFQYMAILFTEIYLDKYYNEFNSLYSEFLTFVMALNKKENSKYPYPNKKAMQKLAFWSATGSGKTLLMHINFLQIQRYNNKKYDNFLLITPSEGLSTQHMDELVLSDIEHKKFEAQKTLEDWSLKNPLKVIEITKIKSEVSSQDGKTIPVEAFEDDNIIFVDEGHKGHSTDAQTWKNMRKELVGKNGFTFEYSATFGEIIDKDETFNEYASSIIFDYRYKYFYEDGFGKDYSILNLHNKEDYGDEYFTGSLLSLYEQKVYFKNYGRQIKPFNLENPLMIFVGSSVSGKAKESDVLQVVKFLARFVNEKKNFKELIQNILTDKSSLVDTNDQPVFATKFPYLRRLNKIDKIEIHEIYEDILKVLFHVKTSKTLQFVEIKNADGEIGLKFDSEYFGVINIGDTSSFMKLIDKEEEDYFFIAQKSNFEQSLFKKIEKKNSPVNFLIGSKKFIEGWNSYRVSAMGLLNIGKKEGSQIIQLFGRGVRLKGYENYLKRSSAPEFKNGMLADVKIPDYLELLETLNIFGLNANYMETFKQSLKEEGIGEYERLTLKIKPTMPVSALYVPRSTKDVSDFTKSIQITNFDKSIAKIKIDLSSKIDVLESREDIKQVDSSSPIKENTFSSELVDLFDMDYIYLELLKYKDLKKYTNLYFIKDDLSSVLYSPDKYSVLCKKEILQLNETDELQKIKKLQDYAIQLLKSYLDKLYNHEKYHWYQENLQYETVSQEDESLIPKEYVFTINSDADTLIKDIDKFTSDLTSFIRVNSEDGNIMYEEDISFKHGMSNIMDFFAMNVHLFKPLIYKNVKAKDLEFIKISPVNLVESERDFIKQLNLYLENDSKALGFDEIYLLRNPSRKGIGFFETKNFYPDFILWTIKGDEQTINFIDPKGLVRVDHHDEKIGLHKEIKHIEKDLKNKSKLNINLNSFILSRTNYSDLNWSESKDELMNKNILFLEDGADFLKQMFEKISS
ncbi:MAG: DEAD/DEAH box helicase family protein [Methanococcoides sp.]|nr:DEAD/DEAH box helicase family protein [Methanococcoides sp.]